MRNDLSRACAPCALRLPASERACPRCGALLVAPETALRGLRASAPRQAIRDLVAFAPPSLGALVALVAGVVVAATSVRDTQVGGEAFRWAVTPAINLVAFTGVALCFAAVLSLPWIGIVHGVAWLGRSRIATISRGVEGRLRVEAFPRGGSRRRSHVGDAVASLRALLVRRWRSAVLLGYVLLLALELALELATPKPFFVGRSIGTCSREPRCWWSAKPCCWSSRRSHCRWGSGGGCGVFVAVSTRSAQRGRQLNPRADPRRRSASSACTGVLEPRAWFGQVAASTRSHRFRDGRAWHFAWWVG